MTGHWIGSAAEIAGVGMGTALGAGFIACAFCIRFIQVLAGSWTATETYQLV
jgi:hypothetical protein